MVAEAQTENRITALPNHQKEIAGMIGAQLASYAVAPAFMLGFKSAAPGLYRSLISSVSKHFVQPHLAGAEKLASNFFRDSYENKEWREACEKGDQAKADYIAEQATDLGLTYAGSLLGAVATKAALDKWVFKTDTHWGKFAATQAIDLGIYLGAVVVLPQKFPDQISKVKSFVSKSLQNMGMKEDTAHNAAMAITYHGIPDTISLGLGTALYLLTKEAPAAARG